MVQDVEFVVTQPGVVRRPLKCRIDRVRLEPDRVIIKSQLVFRF